MKKKKQNGTGRCLRLHLPYLKGKEEKLGLPTLGKQEASEANLGTGLGVEVVT